MKDSVISLMVLLALCMATPAAAESDCDASVEPDSFFEDTCDDDTCDISFDFDVEVEDCMNSRGTFDADISINGSDGSRSKSNGGYWNLSNDDDTTVDGDSVRIYAGEYIDDVDVDNIDCTCYDEDDDS